MGFQGGGTVCSGFSRTFNAGGFMAEDKRKDDCPAKEVAEGSGVHRK